MEKNLVVINKNSGNYSTKILSKLEGLFIDKYDLTYVDIDDDYLSLIKSGDYDLLTICGGDGTLNSVLNKIKGTNINIYYFPCGTLNEKSKSATYKKDRRGKAVVGTIDNLVYTYVAACGSFTPIGYSTSVKLKKTFKVLAYIGNVVNEYKVHHISAKINIDGEKYDGVYTLIMMIKSYRCFGFSFNHLYDPRTDKGHILLIKSPKKNNLWGWIKMFFPFFRAFFIGFRDEYKSKNMLFKEFSHISLELEQETVFDIDGERVVLCGCKDLSFEDWNSDFEVVRNKAQIH